MLCCRSKISVRVRAKAILRIYDINFVINIIINIIVNIIINIIINIVINIIIIIINIIIITLRGETIFVDRS
jgi:hypothetical protein